MFFDKLISLRLSGKDYIDAENIVKHNKDRYENVGHYIRCAIIAQNNKHNGKHLQ